MAKRLKNVSTLRCLYLRRLCIKDQYDIEGLAKSIRSTQSEELCLIDNLIEEDGAKYLSEVLQETPIEILGLESNMIKHDGPKYLGQCLKNTKISSLHIRHNRLGERGEIYFIEGLRGTQIVYLDLQGYLGDEGAKDLAEVLPDTQIKTLLLAHTGIRYEGGEYLGQCLKYTQISTLRIRSNKLGDKGIADLAQGLKGSQIEVLDIPHNDVGDEGLISLAQILKDTQIKHLLLEGNRIGVRGGLYLSQILNDTKLESCAMNIFHTDGSENCIDQDMRTLNGVKTIEITLHGKIGYNGAQYLNQIFKNVPLYRLRLSDEILNNDHVKYLAQAFKDIQIEYLTLFMAHLRQTEGVKYLAKIFKESHITRIELNISEMEFSDVKFLAEFLREILIIELDISGSDLGDEVVEYLIPALWNSTILKLDLSFTKISATGIQYLTPTFKHNLITHVKLRFNSIGDIGAKHLANGLKGSQITHVDVTDNQFTQIGYQYLADVIEDTNICVMQFMDDFCYNGVTCDNFTDIKRDPGTTVAYKITHAFEALVRLNPLNDEFEFILPEAVLGSVIEEYAYLIKQLTDKPQVKAHILNMKCFSNPAGFDFQLMKKINSFVDRISDKFNEFFNNYFPAFLPFNYIDIVKKFEDAQLFDIVKNLLLHRGLYYIDENQEILHPYIYKLLHKHKMIMFHEKLEPNKKKAIIAFYQNHLDNEDVQDVLDLLN